jgi:hypothetical protein
MRALSGLSTIFKRRLLMTSPSPSGEVPSALVPVKEMVMGKR